MNLQYMQLEDENDDKHMKHTMCTVVSFHLDNVMKYVHVMLLCMWMTNQNDEAE